MSRIFLPPTVKRELRDNTAQFAAAVRSATFEDAVCHKWNRELVRLDPLLRLVKNRSDSHWVVGTPLVPGAYHLLYAGAHGGPMTVRPLVDGEGRPLPEPPGSLLEQLRGMDLQNPAVTRRMREQVAEAERRAERSRELTREQRQDTILDQYKKVTNASVSMNDSVPWTQNNQPAARRARHEKRKAKGLVD